MNLNFFVGDYDYFSFKLEQKEALISLDVKDGNSGGYTETPIKESQLERKEYNKAKNRLQSLLQEEMKVLEDIQIEEAKINKVLHEMGEKENYSDSVRITSLISKKDSLENSHSLLEEKWFLIVDEIEQLKEIVTL